MLTGVAKEASKRDVLALPIGADGYQLLVRVIAWLWGATLGERRRKPGHFAPVAPPP